MKLSSTHIRVSQRITLTLFLFFTGLLSVKTVSAHNVLFYNPPCFTQGSNVTISVMIANAGAGSYYHWQYRIPGGSWTYLANGNNTINGRVFSVANASFNNATSNNSTATGALLTPAFTISNVGTPAYTTQLDGVEFRVLMTDGLDPQTNVVNTWGGEEFLNGYEAKYIRLNAKPATETCYSNCTGNALVNNPSGTTVENFWGGFEAGNNMSDNMSAPVANGTTAKAYSDIPEWTGAASTGALFKIMNNPDSMNASFAGISPHSGRRMMVVSNLTSTSTKVWYRTISVPTASGYFNGQVTLKAWFSKIDALNNPVVKIDIQGSVTTTGGTFTAISENGNSGTSGATNINSAAGVWVQKTFTFMVPAATYKRLQISIVSSNANASNPQNFAIDDICLLEPAAITLPVVLTGFKGAYANGVARLTWSTEQEMNSNYFEIERSTDGTSFSTIGKVYATGNSAQQRQYGFDDIKANAGNNYYRLRMVDKDGSFQYSAIVMLTVNIKGINITGIYPAPFTDKVNVSVSSEISETAQVKLFDNTGKTVAQQQSAIHKGITILTLNNLDNLAKGFYIIEVRTGDTVVTRKLIK